MENNNNNEKLSSFLEGKGFYITLAVCLCIIGVSGYVLFFAPSAEPVYEVEIPPITENAQSAGADIPDVSINIEDEEPSTTAAKEEKPASAPVKITEAPTEAVKPSEPEIYIPPVIGKVSRSFSMGELVYDKTMGDYRTHNGIDIECEVGAQVACFGNGKVEKVYNDELYGNCVVISHEDGIVSVYKGLDRGITLTEGAEIKAGDIIGAAGGTNIMENEEVPHIHFEVMKDGQYIDPLGMIK